jgi:CPA1 family monovalent cation:H+ antiporter
MTVFQTIALLLSVAAAGAAINYGFLKLPSTVGLMTFSLVLSMFGLGLNHLGWIDLSGASQFVASVNFSSILLHGLLSFLLFAGGLQINLSDLKRYRTIVTVLSTLSVVVACFITGSIVWWVASIAGFPIPYIDALLFGALIAPTDPVAVMAILKETAMPNDLRVKIGSESLLNDGVGVVLFLALLGLAQHPHLEMAPERIGLLVLWSGWGGILMGLALGWIGLHILMLIDDYKVEVLITLALASGGYCLAEFAQVSAPITMVVAGLVIGNHGRILGMSNRTRKHVDMFWELLDEILNAVLFILMGLEMLVIKFEANQMPLGLAAIFGTLLGRYISVAIPVGLMRSHYDFGRGTVALLTWGGLRGGISIALALSLPNLPTKPVILTMTYLTVIFSVLLQGTTFKALAQRFVRTTPAPSD